MEKQKKKPYDKPVLRKIELAAEEVLTAGCKVTPADFSGASGNGCTNALCSMSTGT